MMEEEYRKWLADDDPKKMEMGSRDIYRGEINLIESTYSVNIDTEYSKDECEKLLNLIATDPDIRSKSTRDNKHSYVNKYIKFHKSFDENKNNIFPETADTETCIEGARISVQVNKYERDTVAREKCIAHYGCYCHVCDLDFEKMYGEIGKGFIHVHHLMPLHKIGKEYIVDSVNDLLPVCPNCHAMLHRKINGAYLSVDKLKEIIIASATKQGSNK